MIDDLGCQCFIPADHELESDNYKKMWSKLWPAVCV